jgi:hypothetical protein
MEDGVGLLKVRTAVRRNKLMQELRSPNLEALPRGSCFIVVISCAPKIANYPGQV